MGGDEIERRVIAMFDGLGLPYELLWIILGGGSRSLKIKISPEIFHNLPGATVVAGLSNPI